jgi:glycosyltransferase involved in cell wall biosynthesis
MKLSIIIPVFNEEKTIINLLKKVNSVDYGIPTEIIVVNDGSTDRTHENLLKIKKSIKNINIISYKKNKGKGHAIKQGIKNISGDIMIIQDADFEYDPNQIPTLIKPIMNGQYKIVYGSRFLGSYENMKFTFLFGNKVLTFITNVLFKSSLTDVETCYKVIHKSVLKELNLESDGFEIEAEITAKILKNGYKIKEIPVTYKARTKEAGKKIKVSDGLRNLLVLIKIRSSIGF